MHPPMVEQELTYQKLQIPSSDIYEAMGYKDSMPDGMVIEEINTLLDCITPLLRPRFLFFLTDGLLDTEKATLTVKDTVLSIGKTIARQLRGSEAFAFFTATAGVEFEEFQHLLQQKDDMVKIYIADSLGSIIAEKAADCMEEELAVFIEKRGWKRTTTLAANMALTLGTVFSIGVGILYLWVFPAEQYDVWPHFMLLSFYLFVIIGIGMIVVSLWDKSPQLGILNMEKIEDKPARIVLILWGLLIVTMIGLYIFFNGH